MASDATKEILSHILERLDGIDEKLENLNGVAAKGAVKKGANPTPTFTNDNGDRVYKTDGCTPMKDRDTGEPGFWVETVTGKPIPVSGAGYPLWLGPEERPDHPDNK